MNVFVYRFIYHNDGVIKINSLLIHMARPKEELSYIEHVRPKTSLSIHDVGWTSVLRPEHVPWIQT